MAIQKQTITTVDKILNSDIYDLTEFVDNIKKRNIDCVDEKETLLVGMYGYLGYEFTSLLQNSIVVSSELANEAIPTRAKFDRNVITHALSLGVKKVAATPANMKVLLCFPEKALRNNMIDGRFILKATTPIYFDEIEFHTDYDIQIDLVNLNDSTNGSNVDYVYTARYLMDPERPNPISTIDNVYLPPLAIFKDVVDNMVVLITNLHQVEYSVVEHKVVGNDNIANKTFNFSFENQLAHFSVTVEDSNNGIIKELTPVYDGLYNQVAKDFCYYQYINSNTIRIRFTPDSYQPETNCNVRIKIYTSKGSEGNFQYSEDLNVRLTSDEYTNLYMIVKQRGTDGSSGGLDRKTVEELQKIIPKEALSRGFITTLSDLRNYFNSINNENSVLHVFRKEDNILTRIYYTYCLMKDSNYNVVPTNTIPVYIEESDSDLSTGKMFIESGTPIYHYKYGEGSNLNLLKNNYIGYMQENVVLTQTIYDFMNNTYNFFNGTPTDSSLEEWYKNNKMPDNISYKIQPNPNAYKFITNSSIYFKLNPEIWHIDPNSPEYKYFDEWYNGTITGINSPYRVYKNGKFHYFFSFSVRFYDPHKYFASRLGGSSSSEYAYCSQVIVPDYFVDMSVMSQYEKENYIYNTFAAPNSGFNTSMMLLSGIMNVGNYSYDAQDPNYSFDNMKLDVGDNIRFCTYNTALNKEYEYLDITTWKLGEILSIKYRNSRIVGLEVLVHNEETDDFIAQSFRLPISGVDDSKSLGKSLNNDDIIRLYVITKFLYTTPLSIVLSDSSRIDSHRITASYYLDTIKETRYMDFRCINSNSPLQYIMSSINVERPSYLNTNRYEYIIRASFTPNIGSLNDEMINRTQLIGVFYNEDNSPAFYSIGRYLDTNGDSVTFGFNLFTRPFEAKKDSIGPETVDDNHRLYIGDEIPKQSLTNEEFLEFYRIYSTSYPNSDDPTRPTDASEFDKDDLGAPYLSSVYLPFNLKMRIYMLYKYDVKNESERKNYEDSLTQDYTYNRDNYIDEIPLYEMVNKELKFDKPHIDNSTGSVTNYKLSEMVLTNVYDTHDGINLLYDYSNLMNSYVTALQGANLFNTPDSTGISYIINRVPCVRYFYFNTEYRINKFITEMKRKINYVLDALDPLETTFGIDFKFFNTYGPSRMYHITNETDGTISNLIDNVALNLTFRAKFYNENSDKDSIIPLIKDDIKNYIEELEDLNDIHFPNLTTEIETKYSEYLIFFEYVEFNIYDANYQHIITDENMEMLTVVPEFLNVDTDDYTGLPRIEIRIVT